MAVYIPKNKLLFIHSPKTAGSSVIRWFQAHTECIAPRGRELFLHAKLPDALEKFPKTKTSFVIVRNPWDWCVSWYFYEKIVTRRNIEWIKKNPSRINIDKDKHDLDLQTYKLNILKQGFANYIDFMDITPQYCFTEGVDKILTMENLKEDFKQIQQIVNVYTPLPNVNVGKRKRDYRAYYTKKLRDIVADKYSEDIKRFGYKYETP